MEGTIVEKLECRPYADRAYMNMKAKAMVIAAQPKRKVEQLDSVVTTFKPISDHKHNVRKETQLSNYFTICIFIDRIRQAKKDRRKEVANRQNGRYGHAVQCF